MLLYERGGEGPELTQSPLCANVLFIMRVSEISCEVVGEGPKGRRSDRGGDGRTKHPVHSCSLGLLSPAPAFAFRKGMPCRDGALRWLKVRVGKSRGGGWVCRGVALGDKGGLSFEKAEGKEKSFLLTRPRPEPKVQVPLGQVP